MSRLCCVCRQPIPRHALDTDATYRSRDVCSREHMRIVKGSAAERGRMAWMTEDQRWDAWTKRMQEIRA
ncbi:MAG: hypothetical protein JNM26_16455 [Ideonella sp.]|nr:hypothetical protein [Ideonella sp.]